MALTHTRTHTYFWGAEDLAPLREEVEKLAEDWNQRREYVPMELVERGDHRVAILRAAVALAGEQAD